MTPKDKIERDEQKDRIEQIHKSSKQLKDDSRNLIDESEDLRRHAEELRATVGSAKTKGALDG